VLAKIDDGAVAGKRRRDLPDACEELCDRHYTAAGKEQGSRRMSGMHDRRVENPAHQLARLKMSEVLTPPNAKLLLITCSTSSERPSPEM